MFRSVELKDYMQTDPVCVKQDQGLFDAVSLILQHKISGLCVVDDDRNLVGILSEMDCLNGILSATYNGGGVGQVSQFMTTNVIVANSNASIVDVASDMLKLKHRRRPVVENGRLVGQITCRQLLRAVRSFSDKASH